MGDGRRGLFITWAPLLARLHHHLLQGEKGHQVHGGRADPIWEGPVPWGGGQNLFEGGATPLGGVVPNHSGGGGLGGGQPLLLEDL